MHQSQQIHSAQDSGFIPDFVHDAVKPDSHTDVENIRPITLAEAATFLGMEESEVVSFAQSGELPFKYSEVSNRYFFNRIGLVRFCESMGSFDSTKFIQEYSAATTHKQAFISEPTGNAAHSEALSTVEISYDDCDSRSDSSEEVLQTNSPTVYDSTQVALERLQYACKLSSHKLTKLLDQWVLDKDEKTNKNKDDFDTALLKRFGVNVGLVKTTDPSSGYRMDMRSIKLTDSQIKGIEKRPRLKSKTLSDAIVEASQKLQRILKNLGITFGLSSELKERNKTLLFQAKKHAERKKRDNGSSDYHVDGRNRKVALWNYVFAHTDFCSIDDEFIEQIIDVLITTGRKHSTVNKYLIELRAMYKYALAKTWIKEHIEIPSYQSGNRCLIEMKRTDFNVFSHIAAQNIPEQNALSLAFETGLRKGNVISNIDVANIKINDEQSTKLIKQSFITLEANAVKGRKKIDIHLPLAAKEAVVRQLKWREANGITHPNLFALDNDGTTIKFDITLWEKGLEDADLPLNFRFHHFRHNRAYQLLLNGGTFEDVRQLLGLASIKMVQFVYGHMNVTHGAITVSNIAAENS